MSSDSIDTKTRILNATLQLVEQRHGLGVSMGEIAKEAGISRQALYLHYASRTELMIATVHYVDEEKGLNDRLKQLETATTGMALLEKSVEVWGNYIPEIYGLAKALFIARETDEAAAAAWDDCMFCLKDACKRIIEVLDSEGNLASEWSIDEAVDMLWTLLSIQNWEQLKMEDGWSTDQYITRMTILIKRTFVENHAGVKP